MLWDDVGMTADEAYRQSLYELMGFTENLLSATTFDFMLFDIVFYNNLWYNLC